MEEVKYFLVLEKRLGDYNLIDINKLDICMNIVTNDIASIDNFTCVFTEEEIKSAIMRSNIVNNEYLNGNLKIVSDAKHHLEVLTKDKFIEIREFQLNDSEIDRDFKNKIFGMYKKVVESTFEDKSFIKGMLDRFKKSLKDGSKNEIFSILEELPYNKSRMIYLNIYEVLRRKKEENLRKLEKIDE